MKVTAQQLGSGSPAPAQVFQPGIMNTLAGNSVAGNTGDGGPATSAELTNGIRGIAADTAGDVFFIDDTNETVRVVYEGGATAAQLITAENPSVTSPQIGYIYDLVGVEGSSGTPSSGTLGSSAKLKTGAALAIDAAGDVYFSDTGTSKVWVVYAGGSGTAGTNLIALEAGVTAPRLGYIYPVAGASSTLGYVGNGVLATSSGVEFHGINDVKFDAAGDMYIVDQGNCAIREVGASNGYLNTIVGNGTCAVQANNGPASSTELDQPYGIAVDVSGNLYIADKGSVNEIRMVYEGGSAAAALVKLENPTIANATVGYIYNVAGGGTKSYPFGVLGTSSKLAGPTMVAVDAAGNIYINDNSLVDQVNPLTGVLSVVAGNSTLGYAGDGGPATSASMNGTRCVAVDAAGRIYVTDATNLRVREVSQGIIVFPGQPVNTTSAPMTIQLSNAGNAILDFTGGSPIFGGANASDFALDPSSPSNTCNLSPLSPATSCVLAITYTPSASGASAATLSYTTNGVLSPQQITLQGLLLPPTTTALQASSQNVTDDSSVTFTATVSGVSNPSGSVSFANGSTVLGTATLSSGVATLTYTTAATGLLSVTATYAGNSTTAGSTSNVVSVNVTGTASSTTTLTASSPSINQGQSVTFTATVTGSGATPTGSVQFTEGSTSLGAVSLNASGVATFSTTSLPTGSNSVQASYLGDSNYTTSSSFVTVQVYGMPTLTLSASAAVIVQGQSETLTATAGGSGVTPTGTMTFYNGSTALGTATLSSGVAVLSITTLPLGSNSLTAAYSGDGKYNAGVTSAVGVTVIVQSVALVFQPGIMTTLAGNGISGHTGDGGQATGAELTNGIRGIAADAAGDVFFVDDTNDTVRVVYEGGATAAQLITAENPSVTSPQVGYIYVLAGGEGSSGTPSNGTLGTSARLKAGAGLTLDAAGDVYFNDTGTNKVWIIYAGGSGTAGTNLIGLEAGVASPQLGYIYAIAGGSSTLGYAGNGVLATSSGVEFHGINDIKFDLFGDMYLVDQGNCAIREVSAATGYLNTIVGNGTCAVQANNGPANSTELDQPYGIAVDSNGNLYIADKGTVNEIRMVYAGGSAAEALITLENPTITNPTVGYIYNVAGGGTKTFPFGVLGTSSKLAGPTMVAVDAAGNIYINDNSLVDQVNALTGVMSVIAGTATLGYAGDGGPATSASMNGTRCLTVDPAGRIYVTDATNLRVREVSQGIVIFPGQATNTISAPQTIQLTNAGNSALNFTGGAPSFGGANASDFALDASSPLNTCNLAPLQPAASCTLAITYTPSGPGPTAATLSYTTNGILSPQQVTVQGLVLPATTTTLAASASSVIDGSSVTFTATVTGIANPAGTVTFTNGAAVLGTVTVSSGMASLQYPTTATGVLSVIATYSGNANTGGSTSNTVSVNVTGGATSTTAVTPSATTINQGQTLTLTASVSGSSATPTGNVQFTDGSTSLGTAPLNAAGIAMLSTTVLPTGQNSVQALYLGDANYAASSSLTAVQVYGIPTVTLAASSTVINQGLSETLTATAAGNGATPTGTITFYDGSTALGTSTMTSGVATLSTNTLPGGVNNLTAGYGGDTNYNSGTSGTVSVTVNIENVAFSHPGGWLSASDISRIRTAVANQTAPYYAAYLALPSSPSTTFTPNPGSEVTVGAVNNSTYSHLQSDAASMWLLAVKWVASGNQTYATTLCNAVDGWSATLTTIDGTDAVLRSGILGGVLAQAAEICAYANPAWPNKARAQNMIRLFAQIAHNFAQGSVPNGNWEAFNAAGTMEMAVFLDDRELYNRAVNYFLFGAGNGRITHYVIDSAGQTQESGRDQTHTVDGIGSTAEGAQVAWHQGLDLFGAYSNRLLAGFEYTGGYIEGTTPPFVPNRDAWNDPLNSYFTISNPEPVTQTGGPWEMVYNHYANLQGFNTPNTASVVTSTGYRPEPASYSDSGPGTLLYTRSPGDTDPVTSVPVAPIILSSYGTTSGIMLNWVGSVGATSYTIQRGTASGGPYSTIATISGESNYSYTDTTASGAGTTYYYVVTASNSFGQSTAGAEVQASSGLPAPWANSDIGTLGLNGAGGSDYLGASSFTLRASGAIVGNSSSTVYYDESNTAYYAIPQTVTPTTDSMQFAYIAMNGDGKLVARVNAPLSPVTSAAGLMMRSSLNSDDAMIANMVQYNGLAFATSRTAPGITAVTSGPVSISTATTALPDSSSLLVAPYWVQLTRAGNRFTASVSADNVNWTMVSQQTLTMPTTIYAGLALASGNTTLPTTATFDEVSAPGWTQPPTVPAAPANLTAVAAKGVQLTWSAPVAATSYSIQRNGVNIASLAAPVAGLYASAPGTMYYVDYNATPGSTNTYAVSATGAGGTGPLSVTATAIAPAVTAPFLSDSVGIPYVVGTVGVPLTYQVGLTGVGTFSATGLPSGLTIDPNTGIISGTPMQGGSFSPVITVINAAGQDSWTYTFTIAGAPLPAGMEQVDLGFLQAPGIAGTSGSSLVNTGTGGGAGAVCDVLHFAYYQLTGDGSITVNLNSVTTASSDTTLSQTGIMMRNTLTCDSQMMEAHAGIGGSTTLGSAYRAVGNASVFDYLNAKVLGSASLTLPTYLQITRSGNTFTSSYSTDGSTWNAITSQTIGMNPTVYVGLVAAPNDSSLSNTSTGAYSNLGITSASPSLINSPSAANGTVGVPFSFTITSAISPATYGATSLPPGLSINPATGVISGIPTTAGTYTVTASAVNGVASGNAPLSITIGQAAAAVTLGGLSQTYDGSPESATVNTSPAGLAVQVTYNGSTTVPTTAGSYSVVATVNDTNYAGAASGTLVIAPGTASVTLGNLVQTYTGSPLVATAATSPAGLQVGLLYNGSSIVPTAVGSYSVVATVNDPNYTGTASGTLVIAAGTASVTLGNLAQTYTGSPLSAIATTSPTGLAVMFLYNGSATIPTAAGSYSVVATVNDPNYTGTASGSLVIAKAPASVTFANLTQTYSASPEPITVATSPSGLAVSASYAGTNNTVYGPSAVAPTNPGAYTFTVTVIDPNYVGSQTGTLTISQVDPTISLSLMAGMPASTPYGTTVYFSLTTVKTPGCPTGTVQFLVDGVASGSPVVLSDTSCNQPVPFSISTLSTGTHSISASYSGDNYFIAENAAAVSYTVMANTTTVTLGSSGSTVNVGQPVTYTATVMPGSVDNAAAPSGSIVFYDGTTQLATVPLATNTASFTTSSLSSGLHSITAAFVDSDGNFAGSSSAVTTETVNLIVPVINWTPSTTNLTYGIALDATMLNASAVDANSNPIAGTFTYNFAVGQVLSAGTVNITASFVPADPTTHAVNAATLTFTIAPATLTVTANSESTIYGSLPSSFPYTLSGFINGDTAAVVTGTASCSTTATASSQVGSYPIACAAGTLASGNYAFSFINGTLSVTQAAPTINWTALAAITYGTALSATQLNAMSTVPGTFVYSPAAGTMLGAGAQTLSVTFTPSDSVDYASATQTMQLTVNKASVTVTLSGNPSPAIQGTAEQLTAIISGAGQPSGTAVFTSGGTTLCSASLNASGVASCSFVPAASGSLPITASYQGDTNHLTNSATMTLSVYDSSVKLQLSSTQLVYPGATNTTTCVTPASATGTVQIYDGTTLLTTQSLQGGGCAYWYISPGLSAGTQSLTAVYSGDNHNPAGTSLPVAVTVSPVPVTLSASCWNSSFPYGGSYSCTVSLSSNAGSALGSLGYVVDAGSSNSVAINNGSAQFSVSRPNAGNHSLTISYAAQGNFAAAGPATESFTVTQASTQIQLTPSSYYQSASAPLTLTASLTSSSAGAPIDGTVAFFDGTTLLGTLPAGSTVTFNVTGMSAGTQAFSAVYQTGPSGNYASANSATVNVQLH